MGQSIQNEMPVVNNINRLRQFGNQCLYKESLPDDNGVTYTSTHCFVLEESGTEYCVTELQQELTHHLW